jgi:hypothetical protein
MAYEFLGDVQLFKVPEKMVPGRYRIGITLEGQQDLGWMPFLSNWDPNGKRNIEAALRAAGIEATAVTAENARFVNPRQAGFLDVFGVTPTIYDFQFDLIVDIFGPTEAAAAPVGVPQHYDQDLMAGVGALPAYAIWVIGSVAVLAIADAIVQAMGGGDVVIRSVTKILEFPVKVVGGVATTAGSAAGGIVSGTLGGLGFGTILLVGGGVALGLYLLSKSPKGRLARAVLGG